MKAEWPERHSRNLYNTTAGKKELTLVSGRSTPRFFSKSPVKSFHALQYREVTCPSSFPLERHFFGSRKTTFRYYM